MNSVDFAIQLHSFREAERHSHLEEVLDLVSLAVDLQNMSGVAIDFSHTTSTNIMRTLAQHVVIEELVADRDPQRFLVYDAQTIAKRGLERQLNPVECQLLASKIQRHPELVERYGRAMDKKFKMVLKGDRGRISAYAMLDIIYLPKWAHNNWTICHEVAHVINGRIARGREGHGQEFCSIYTDIVEHVMSPEAAWKLRDEFTKGGVKF